MSSTMLNAIKQSLAAIAAAAVLAGCGADATVGPRQENDGDLGACQNLQVPVGAKLASHMYATGVQIYRWNDTAWVFTAPSAVLFAEAEEKTTVAIHYAGPTWQGAAGSKVVGTVIDRCTPDVNAIPWLLLGGVSSDGPGPFQGATFIQRVKTTGGKAPVTPGTVAGEVVSVPYTAEYLFYRP